MIPFEFTIKGPPISKQAKSASRNRWKAAVAAQASAKIHTGDTPTNDDVAIKITYYYEGDTPDVDNIIKPIQGDCRDLAPKGIADRVLMGYIGNTHHYLDVALNALKEEGGVIHYHESVPDKLKFIRPVERVKKVAEGHKVEILNRKIIKTYSPGVFHVVVDAWVH